MSLVHESSKDEKDIYETIVTAGFVCHIPVENLDKLKTAIKNVPGVHPVIFKTASGKLWLKEGDEP